MTDDLTENQGQEPPRPDVVGLVADEAVKLYRLRDKLINNPGQHAALMHVDGCISGLRIALCVLKGWDVEQESDKEGEADQLVIGRWQELHPEEWGA